MDLDWTQQSAAGVSLVAARLRNRRATDRRVRLENRLDGPVFPPRRNGVPEAGWDRGGVTTVVPAGGTVALGYACPAPESTPPVAVEAVEPAADRGGETDPATAVRKLGDHRPPRDVLDRCCDGTESDESVVAETSTRPRKTTSSTDTHEPLTDYRTRIETAEALGAVGVEGATDLLATNDGLVGVEVLAESLEADATRLRALAAAAETLADRAEAATPPTQSLRRLS
ncbi:DUF7857 domain-containing protein [Halolamina salifodinae]|uniref:DUF8080 domain-containing protein n=1 Tax=Halolamina salifodinae TaxID=1202767 RepID=A0A8T4GYB9_9EURY|nr:hypothetical protein [Halolamina salifodinae]MBP1987976.1 hypothetical protein [Halolamina salifodinae]